MNRLRNWAKRLQRELFTLYFAYRDPRTPWYAKILSALVVAYAFSPIDLIPDFIPILGYLDDLILVPLGIFLALRMIPDPVLHHSKIQAEEQMSQAKPKSWTAAIVIILLWLLVIVYVVYQSRHFFNGNMLQIVSFAFFMDFGL